MTYLGPKLFGNFKAPAKARRKARDRREGMSPSYLASLGRMPSVVSGMGPCIPHHLRCGPAAFERGIGLKASDQWAIPITDWEHMRAPDCVHSVNSKGEFAWFQERGIRDIIELAQDLWEARQDEDEMRLIIFRHRGTA